MHKQVMIAGVVLSVALLGGCAYNTPVGASPNLNVYSSYSEKIPGRFALVVDAEAFNADVKPTGYVCSAHHFPLDMRQAFAASTATTLRQLVDDVQVLERPIPAPELARQGYAGEVIVTAETLNARVQVVEGFWSSTADSVVEVSAGMTVDTSAGRVLGTSAQGFGNAHNGSGAMCGETATAIGAATEKAMRQLLGQLGERLSNSDRLRRAATERPSTSPTIQAAAYNAPTANQPPAPAKVASSTSAPPAPRAAPRNQCAIRIPTDPDAVSC